ncbi:DMT family transporter [Thiomicrolovo sp. ZZH C-3]
MSAALLYLAAFLAGVSLAVQGGFNAQLGVSLRSPVLASLIAYGVSTAFAMLWVMGSPVQWPSKLQTASVPLHLWIAGGLFSVIGITLYYYLIPRIGIAKMFTLGLSGQMLFVMLAGFLGWFNMPSEPMTTTKLAGIVLMLSGVACITYKG